MRKNVFSVLLCLTGSVAFAQVSISKDRSNNLPHPNAILDVKSTMPATAVLLPTVSQISNAISPNGDDTFKGAIVYNKNNASVYEHDGNNWESVYSYITETKPQYLAHFSRPSNLSLSCNNLILGCSADGIMPLTGIGSSDFKGNLINVSAASNVLTVNETGVYRIVYHSYAVINGQNVEAQLRLQKANAATPAVFTTVDSQSFTSTNANLGYTPVFNGSIVLSANTGDQFRLQGFMSSGMGLFNSSVTFQNNTANGIGEIIFEKIVL